MEHRWGRRQSTDVRVRFVSHARIGTGCLSNVSVTGAFMKTKVHLRLLSVVNLSSASHSRKAKGKGVAAFVVRQDSAGVGLEWCEAGHTSIEARLALLAGDLEAQIAGDADDARHGSIPLSHEVIGGTLNDLLFVQQILGKQ
jgi:hypothetical protein